MGSRIEPDRHNLVAPLLCVLLSLFGASAQGAVGEHAPAPSPLRDLAGLVSRSGYAARQDFAWIALSELTAAYERVLENSAARHPRTQRARQKLRSWRRGTQRFVDTLRRSLERLDGSAELGLSVNDAGPPVLYVDRQPVVLSGPELGAVPLLERRIFDAYCTVYDCSGILPSVAQAEQPVPPPRAGRWWLEDYGRASYRTGDGLICSFHGIDERQRKQRACEALASELRALAAALRRAQLAGERIEWGSLRVESLAAGLGQRVLLRPRGAYLRLALPLLAAGDGLNEPLRRWLQHRLEGEAAEAEIPVVLLQGILAQQPASAN